MTAAKRHEAIVKAIESSSFLSISELSRTFGVSEMTIRRDLERLDSEKRLKKTYGGAVPLRKPEPEAAVENKLAPTARPGLLVDRVDALIVTVINPKYDGLLPRDNGPRYLPVIAESVEADYAVSTVITDNYQAGFELGQRVGGYYRETMRPPVHLLDLSYHQPNTQARSQGFLDGLRQALPNKVELVLSVNAEARYQTAYQITRDALHVYERINLIFAINDSTAWGAVSACTDRNVRPEDMLVVPFGLEGKTLRSSLLSCDYCKIGLAMFPEIAGATCIEAAIAAYNRQPLPKLLLTPYAILTEQDLKVFYTQEDGEWKLNLEQALQKLTFPLPLDGCQLEPGLKLPRRIGFVLRFGEHEWYQNLIAAMQEHAACYGIELEVADAEQTLRDEVELRRREIARRAAREVEPGDTLLLDNGPISVYLAEELAQLKDVTVITNSVAALNILSERSDLVLVSTGGVLRRATQALVGPSAEAMLREIRATDEVAQIAPLHAVHKLISDDALLASYRLEISRMGIQVIAAEVRS